MNSRHKLLTLFFVVGLILAMPQWSYGSGTESFSEELSVYRNSVLYKIPDVRKIIIVEAVNLHITNGISLDRLVFVCKDWYRIIKNEKEKVDTPLWKVTHGIKTSKEESAYRLFINGKLLNSTEEYPISMFSNPLKWELYLSHSENDQERLMITTDPKVFFEFKEGVSQLNVLIAPYFLIRKFNTYSTIPFGEETTNWNPSLSPVWIFWRMSYWGATWTIVTL